MYCQARGRSHPSVDPVVVQEVAEQFPTREVAENSGSPVPPFAARVRRAFKRKIALLNDAAGIVTGET